MYQLLLDNDLELLNDINAGPTFKKYVQEQNSNKISLRSSFIDLSIINNKLNSDNINWMLLDNILDTEHLVIKIDLRFKLTILIEKTKVFFVI